MRKLTLAFLTTLISGIAVSQEYTIKANVTGFKDQTKFMLVDVENQVNIDSAVIINNKFTMKGKLPAIPESIWLTAIQDKKFYYTVLFISNEKLSISGDVKDFPFDLTITGSKNQDLFNTLYSQVKAGYKKRNTLVAEAVALKGDSAEAKSKKIWAIIGKLDSTDAVIRKEFIKENLNSYLALDELNFLKSSYNRDTLQKMYDSLKQPYKESIYGQHIATYLKVGDILRQGDSYSDFQAQDTSGQLHKISDIKGRYILLDFSGTYCGPCIESVKDMKDLNAQYPDKLSIVTFSQDAGKSTWLTGINRDKPTWLCLWDGKGTNSEVCLKYGVNGIPEFCLIDPKGKIIALFTGYGDGSLEKTVKGMLDSKLP